MRCDAKYIMSVDAALVVGGCGFDVDSGGGDGVRWR